MAITMDAVYEDGVLKLKGPLPFKEHEKVQVTVEPAVNWVERTYGLIQWTGDPKELRRLVEVDEFSILEAYRAKDAGQDD